MFKILFQALVVIVVVAIISNDELRFQAIKLSGNLFEFIKQAVMFMFEQNKNLLNG